MVAVRRGLQLEGGVLDVEVPYQEHVLPMIPGGMTIKELIKE